MVAESARRACGKTPSLHRLLYWTNAASFSLANAEQDARRLSRIEPAPLDPTLPIFQVSWLPAIVGSDAAIGFPVRSSMFVKSVVFVT